MPLPRKPPRSYITGAIQGLVRSFPSRTVNIFRPIYGVNAARMHGILTEQPVYNGEALFIPAGGSVRLLELGLYEDNDPRLMVAGVRGIIQGDRFRWIDGNTYEVAYIQNRWNAFMIAKLRQVKQG